MYNKFKIHLNTIKLCYNKFKIHLNTIKLCYINMSKQVEPLYVPLLFTSLSKPKLIKKEISYEEFLDKCIEIRRNMDVLGDDDPITDTIEFMIHKMATQGDVMSRSPYTLSDMYIIKNNKFIGPKFDIKFEPLENLITYP